MSKSKKASQRYVSFFSRTTSGQVKVWSCWIEADGVTVSSSWGIKGGRMQFTSDTMKSRGRKGTKAYKTPQQVAQEEHARQVEKKMRAGYVEAEERAQAVQLEKMKSDLDFDDLPRAFAPAKPVREIDPLDAAALERDGKLAVQRKRDGMRHYIVAGTNGRIRVYSRGMDDMTEHFTRLTQELTLPPGTILDAEFVVTNTDDADDFIAVSEICRSKPERARQTMVAHERNGSRLQFMVFDLLFYDRLPTWQLPYRDRRESMIAALARAHTKGRTHFYHVVPMQTLRHRLTECIRLVHKHEWEGLVLWRTDHATQVHLNRSPKRCNCYKFKPMREGDFVATGYELGNGRNSKVVGALNLSVVGNKPGPIHKGLVLNAVGNVGTGFDDATRMAALKWKYPCVVEVRYEKMSKTGLRFPSFLRKRDDKKIHECVM